MSNTRQLVRVCALAAVCATILVVATIAAAAVDQYTARITPAGTTAARAAILRDADFGSTSGWTAGPVSITPRDGTSDDCASFHPKRSDLVLDGAAGVVHMADGGALRIDSSSKVFKQARMLQIDAQRILRAPGLIACVRKRAPSTLRVVSITHMKQLPRIGTFAIGYRILYELRSNKARFRVDVLDVGAGRTEISLLTTSPPTLAVTIMKAEIHLARVLTQRAST